MAETKESLCCDTEEIHEELLKIVDETMPDETELDSLAELFKVFGDPTRIRILFVLFETEVCVCDDPVGSFPSASDPETEPSGKEQKRRKIHVLFSGRRSCTNNDRPGKGTYTGVEISCCLYFLQQQKIQKRGCETTACKKKDQGFAKNPGSFFVCRESRTFHTDFSVDV